MNRLWLVLLPELRQFPLADRPRALRAARAATYDIVELLGMAAGLVLVTALTRYSTTELSTAMRFSAALLNFVVALPLLALILGPFQLRRLRRGLREARRQRTDP